MLNYLQSTATRDRGENISEDMSGTTSTLADTTNQPKTAAKKKKKKKKTLATGTPATTENPPSATCLTAAKAAVVAARQAAEAAEKAAKSASGATVEAANAARAARAAVKAAAEAVKAAEMLVAAEQEAEAEKATELDYDSDEYEKSLAGTTFLYVPVEGDIQVRQTSSATKAEILEWPVTEGHVLSNRNLAKERYTLTGYIRSFNFDGPINKRYSKIYGNGTARIHGPAIIFNEDGPRAVSLTEKDIPIIFRE